MVSTPAATPVLSEPEPRPFGARPVRPVQARARKWSPPGFFPAWARPTNGSPWQGPRRPPGSLRPPPRPRTREPVNFSDALNAPNRHPWATIPLVAGTGRLVQPATINSVLMKRPENVHPGRGAGAVSGQLAKDPPANLRRPARRSVAGAGWRLRPAG